jgi:hypothetical protein
MLNPFFLQGSNSEQNLIQDLINEQLRMYGVEVYYLPRRYVTEKTIIREVIESEFVDACPIEAYLENYDGYEGNTTILSKFGIQSSQEINLVISKERFETYITPIIRDKPNVKLSTRPLEGDLIYFPLGNRLFEIKFVEHEKPFYQLQKNYVYLLKCELFKYQGEIINTGIEIIDEVLIGKNDGITEDGISTIIGQTQTLTLVGVGITATAVVGIVTFGGIRFITVSNRGGGYTSTPIVGISSAPSGGKTGIATATMIGGIVVCNDNVNTSAQSVQSVRIINPGLGYTSAPGIRFIGGGGSGAAATATIGNNIIGIVTVTGGGVGYSTSPTITFTNQIFNIGVPTVSAAATAIVSAAGTITAIRITNAGLGYSVAPLISISPPSMTSSGTFIFNETVTGSSSGTTANVIKWISSTNILEVYKVSGEFLIGENIVGTSSSASHQLRNIDLNSNDDGFVDNSIIEEEADLIIDFSEKNPFGTP